MLAHLNTFKRAFVLAALTFSVGACDRIREMSSTSPRAPEASSAERPGEWWRSGPVSEGLANVPAGIYPYPQSGAQIGQGWDTFNSATTTISCVTVEAAKLEQTSYALSVEQIMSTYSLLRTVESSISVSYKGGGARGSASFSQSRSRQLKADDQNILFNYESLDGGTFAVAPGNSRSSLADDAALKTILSGSKVNDRIVDAYLAQPMRFGGGGIHLTEEAQALLKDDPKRFRLRCGEGFVGAIHRGIRIQLLLTQTGASTAERERLKATLSASGYGASGSASYATSKAEDTSMQKLGYRVFQEGGIPAKPNVNLTEVKALKLQDILPTTEQLLTNPTAFRVIVIPYANIDERAAAAALPTPLRMLSLGDYYLALTDLYNLVHDIRATGETNASTGVTTWSGFNGAMIEAYGGTVHLESVADSILGDLALLEDIIAECYATQSACTVEVATKNVEARVKKAARKAKADTATAASLHAKVDELTRAASALRGSGNPDALRSKFDELTAARYAELLKVYQSSTHEGRLTPGFFLRFYWYLTQIPLPASVLDPSLEVGSAGEIPDRARALNTKIVEAVMSHRLLPWKETFCQVMKSDALCVPDSLLRDFTEQFVVTVEGTAFKIKPPPPPPSDKGCGFAHHRCW